ncbi:MAG TPA: NAD(P)-binding domain-containing protein [Vicinamibacterales bacterium]|nr:NAD(P)-binding domain-containing protein [Vicinamibacterales bacterium]
MNIGIIGSGMVGSALARRLARLGHRLSISNSRGPDTLRQFAGEIDATAATTSDAARSGGIVIVAIPERAVMDLPKDLFAGVAADTVVIDTGNYYPSRDGQIAAIDAGQTESRWVSERLGRPVVKAFNTIYFKNVLEKGAPPGAAGRLAVPVAADGRGERETVLQLVDDLGFDPVDAGGLDDSWRQQPGTPCYGKELEAPGLKEALAAAERNRIAEYRKAADDAARAFFRPPPR